MKGDNAVVDNATGKCIFGTKIGRFIQVEMCPIIDVKRIMWCN